MNPRNWLALAGVMAFTCGHAQETSLSFQTSFGSNMVLPHDQPVRIAGSAPPGSSLTLAAGDHSIAVQTNANGKWNTMLPSLDAGGPYRIELTDSNGTRIALDNVLAGEIWLCSGQSNMAYSVAASSDQPDSYNEGHDNIRLLTVPQRAELQAQQEFLDPVQWQLATDQTVPRFSAVCYFTARKLTETDGIPRGLINASWGGSAIEAWISETGLSDVPGFDRKVQQLQQFRQDRRAGELAFAADWTEWWHENSDQGAVWEMGVLDTAADWRDAPLVNWKTYPDPRLSNHHGILWYSIQFELTAEQARENASFVLGKIDEVDTTWLNGEFVNNTFGYGTRREYSLEPGSLQAGTNQITVNVLNTWDVGGMLGPDDDVGIAFANGEFLPLGTGWKYRFIPRETGQPPRSPWESVAGIAGMFNGMIAPLAPLKPAGVIWYQGESNAEASSSYHSLLTSLVSDWRNFFDDSKLPVVVVQLPNYGPVSDSSTASGWATLRNAQQQVAMGDPLVGLVPTHDAGNDADIHPRRKFIVGSRAAEVIRALASGQGVSDGVFARVIGRPAGSVTLGFSPTLEPTVSTEAVDGFALCESTAGNCVVTSAQQIGSEVTVNLSPLPRADRVRYCWTDGGQCGLQSTGALPVSSFELDLGAGPKDSPD